MAARLLESNSTATTIINSHEILHSKHFLCSWWHPSLLFLGYNAGHQCLWVLNYLRLIVH